MNFAASHPFSKRDAAVPKRYFSCSNGWNSGAYGVWFNDFMNDFHSPSSLSRAFKGAAALAGATLGALALGNALIGLRTPPLSFRLGGEFGRYPARFGDIAFTVAGSGTPVLLLHGLDIGRSMAEWRAVFGPLSQKHTVYALDFPGYGLSDMTREGLNATDFAELITNFITDIIGAPTLVIAAGQAGILACFAARGGARISQLVLSCPTPPALDAPSGQSRAEALVQSALTGGVLAAPILGTTALNWTRSRRNLRKRACTHGFFDKVAGARESEIWHVAAHQKGAAWGQKCGLRGAFGADWRAAWTQSEVPATLVWGRNALREGYDTAPEWLALRPDAHLEVVEEALTFPHLEQPARFLEIVENVGAEGQNLATG